MKKLYTTLILTTISYFSFSQALTSICAVTVTDAGAHEYPLVIWERDAQISPVAIDTFFLYREDVSGNDSLIATIASYLITEYHDVSANAALRSYTYRLRGLDNNGLLGPFSAPMSSIHFNVFESQGILNLEWTNYINTTFSSYNCWDLSDMSDPIFQQNPATTNWPFSAAIPGTTYNMMVDLDGMTPCESSLKTNINSARSNKATIAFQDPSSISENAIQEIKLYPNPTNGFTTLTFSSLSWNETNVTIVDLSGRIIEALEPFKLLGQHTLQLNLENLDAGYYNIIINNGINNTIGFIKN